MTDVAVSWSPERSPARGHNPYLIAFVVSIATFMEVLDSTIANVALRHIAGALAVGIDEITYVITSYLVANAIVLSISGWLSTIIGRKRFYMICVGTFTKPRCFADLHGAFNRSFCFVFSKALAVEAWRRVNKRSLPIHFRPTDAARLLPSTALPWWWRR
jgi:MFS family permease